MRSYNAGVKKTASDYLLPSMLPRVMTWSPRSDEAQKEFLRRTAAHIVSSPNSAQLEMHILVNHCVDKWFAFLRGRWSWAWNTAKDAARQQCREKE